MNSAVHGSNIDLNNVKNPVKIEQGTASTQNPACTSHAEQYHRRCDYATHALPSSDRICRVVQTRLVGNPFDKPTHTVYYCLSCVYVHFIFRKNQEPDSSVSTAPSLRAGRFGVEIPSLLSKGYQGSFPQG